MDVFFIAASAARVFGGDDDDTFYAEGDSRNIIHCGPGVDTVLADVLDTVDADCENVTVGSG